MRSERAVRLQRGLIAPLLVALPSATASPPEPESAPIEYFAWNPETGQTVSLARTSLRPYCCGPAYPAALSDSVFAWVSFPGASEGVPGGASVITILNRAAGSTSTILAPERRVDKLTIVEDTAYYTVAGEPAHQKVIERDAQGAQELELPLTAFLQGRQAAIIGRSDLGPFVAVYDLPSRTWVANETQLPRPRGVSETIGMTNFNEGIVQVNGDGCCDEYAFDARRGTFTPIERPNETTMLAASGPKVYWAEPNPHASRAVVYGADRLNGPTERVEGPEHALATPWFHVWDGWILLADYEHSTGAFAPAIGPMLVCIIVAGLLVLRRCPT